MTGIERYGSGGPWEKTYGYSRVVKAGHLVHVSGCTGVDGNGNVVSESAYEQAVQALANVEAALGLAEASIADVVRTRVYVTDITLSDEVGRAHGEVFEAARPAMAIVGVAALVSPQMLVEIEADAYLE